MIRLKDIVVLLQNSFRVNRIPEPTASTYYVLGKALNRPRRFLERASPMLVSLYHYAQIKKIALRRLNHEPIQYILGEWGFRDLKLKMKRPVLIPRPETEQLVDIALELFPKNQGRFHFIDVGCGCGAISLALLKAKPNAYGIAVDVSLDALKLTLMNFRKVFGKDAKLEGKLDLIQSSFKDFAEKNVHRFDLIISNPPYIPSQDISKLERQVKKYEDYKALDGGQYGLDLIWELIRSAGGELKNGGFLVMETNLGHSEYLEEYFRNNGNLVHHMTYYGSKEDFTFRKRFVILQKKKSTQGKETTSEESD